ncbi:MAG: prepilin-type N-terminal cleavage/methylation domain-containing protein [Thermoanaerobaculia bacterium]
MNKKGYNLIEVLVAIALLAWVVLVVAGLFIWGQRGIYSGKQQTKAVALGQKIYEDLNSLEFPNKYAIFQATDGQSSITTTYDTSSTNPFSQTDQPVLFSIFNTWINSLKDLSENSKIICTLTPKRSKDGGTPTFGNCLFIQFDLTIEWTQLQRTRRVNLSFTFGGG